MADELATFKESVLKSSKKQLLFFDLAFVHNNARALLA